MRGRIYNRFVLAIALATAGTNGLAAGAEARSDFNLPSQPLADSLRAVANQGDINVLFDPPLVADRQAPALRGDYTPQQAFAALLRGTGIEQDFMNERTVVLAAETSATAAEGTAFWRRVRLAQATGVSESEGRDAAVSPPNGSMLEEIIVTATKRLENIQDVPISIAVISNQDIERRGLIGMEDYLRSIPGVSQIDRGGMDNAIVIRGITTSPQSENFNSGTTVASYFDETSITGSAGFGSGGGVDLRPVDIERIEILRGPQGTAYGSASLGGAMRLIPVKPKLDRFGARFAAAYGETSNRGGGNSMLQGVVNVPVGDKLALRAVGYRFDESGFYRNGAGADPATLTFADAFGVGNLVQGFVQDEVGQMISVGGRLAALWRPTDRLDVSLNYLTQQIEQDGIPEASAGEFEQIRLPIAPQARLRGEAGAVADTEMDLANLVLNYDLGWAGWTSVVSKIDSASAFNSQAFFVAIPASATVWSDFESFTAETRLASQLPGRFQFLVGLYYEETDEYFLNTTDWLGAPSPSPTYVTNPVSVSERTRQLDQRALFGEISYDLTEKLTATLGGRYYDYERESANLRREGGYFGRPLGASIPVNLESSESDTSFKANLSYKPTSDSLVYVSWAEGFRLGRPDVGLSSAACDRNSDGVVDGTGLGIESTRNINSDFLENYELGGKFTLFERRMLIESAVYHIKWDGLPIRAFAGGTSCPNASYTANIGAATSDGVELQASLRVIEDLRFDFGAGYTKAELSKDAPGLNPPAFEGARLPGSPEWSANLGVQYDFDVRGRKTFLRVDSFYTGAFYGDLLQAEGLKAGDYIKVDARGGVMIENLSVELFVRNLTNEDAFTWRGIGGVQSGAANPFYGFRLRPRTVGIQLGFSFE